MASAGRGSSSKVSAMRKKRRTIGGFRAHAMGDSFDHSSTADASANFSLSMVPEDQLSCAGGEAGAGSEHIVVAVRVRPLSAAELAEGKRSCCEVLTSNTLVIRKGADPGAYLRSQQGSANEYSFDAVFPPEAGQSEVYEGTAKPHISELFEGINVTVFAYGATGAGKTHTMMGSERVVGVRAGGGPEEVSGIVPQSLVELFRLLQERMETGSGREDETETWAVRVGYLQVYNEQLMDLLSPSSKPLRIHEDPSKGVVVVAGLTEMEVTSSEEVLELLRQGNANRRTEATGANQVSSRSHAVLQVVLTRTVVEGVAGSKSVRESKLSLIDLAGSERASATNNRGEQLRQGANINKSLLSLANCINALAGNRRRRGGKGAGNVKYRDSKLTHLLKASLEGRCRLVMIANVNPSHVFFDDSHNTLKYANRAKNIKIDPKTTESLRGASVIMTEKEAKLAKEYQALKDRNQLMEAQLESFRNSRGHIAVEPPGFTDLFAPNTSSIMSVASSTPGHAERYGALPPVSHSHPQPQLMAPAPGAMVAVPKAASGGGGGGSDGSSGGVRTRRSCGAGRRGDVGGGEGAMPPPVPRDGVGGKGGGRGAGEEEREEGVDSGEDCGVTSPHELRLGVARAVGTPSGSGSKRKRQIERAQEEAAVEEEKAMLMAALAAERTRVRELEGKVRELENSMARMGAQQDVNMELIGTFRHQKETAEEAAEYERSTSDELLRTLREKEFEISQLRAELAEPTRAAPTVSLSTAAAAGAAAAAAVAEGGGSGRRLATDGDDSGHGSASRNSSCFRSGMVMEGDSAFGPLGQIEENGGGGGEAVGAVTERGRGTQREQRLSGARTPSEASSRESTNTSRDRGEEGGSAGAFSTSSIPTGRSTVEVASAIKSQRRKSSMVPRARKSMIPAPRSTGRSSSARRLGDVTNSSGTKLNDHLSGGTPSAGKKVLQLRPSPVTAFDNTDLMSVNIGGGDGGERGGRRSSRRVSSRTGATPQRLSVAGRTRSRVSMAPACPLRDLR